MTKLFLAPVLCAPLLLGACIPSTGSTTGDAAVVGGLGGAALGQAIGGDTEATLGGAAAGAAIGAGVAAANRPRNCVDSFGRAVAC